MFLRMITYADLPFKPNSDFPPQMNECIIDCLSENDDSAENRQQSLKFPNGDVRAI